MLVEWLGRNGCASSSPSSSSDSEETSLVVVVVATEFCENENICRVLLGSIDSSYYSDKVRIVCGNRDWWQNILIAYRFHVEGNKKNHCVAAHAHMRATQLPTCRSSGWSSSICSAA